MADCHTTDVSLRTNHWQSTNQATIQTKLTKKENKLSNLICIKEESSTKLASISKHFKVWATDVNSNIFFKLGQTRCTYILFLLYRKPYKTCLESRLSIVSATFITSVGSFYFLETKIKSFSAHCLDICQNIHFLQTAAKSFSALRKIFLNSFDTMLAPHGIYQIHLFAFEMPEKWKCSHITYQVKFLHIQSKLDINCLTLTFLQINLLITKQVAKYVYSFVCRS